MVKETPSTPIPSSPNDPSRIVLPPVPAELVDAPVAAWSESILIDTYLPQKPSDYPAFLDRRVYQGSSGRVHPLPFHEKISAQKAPHLWEAIHLENAWIRLVILPELGGRIHIGYDKGADYDFFYRNNVIKPALVGLAGPWISGGVEFNWPQHHRPATFLPMDWEIEHEADGAVTVWCSDHDPFARMKGAHGIRLRADSTVIEARVRVTNRTEDPQTFLWWANVAAAVNDDYQVFFPTDVHEVADHAKRAVTTYPAVADRYYGVDYPAQVSADRPDGDRLDWYRNIPVPTSYMILDTEDDFFGGYDHGRGAGFVSVADHGFAPGKKLWTWGNAPFGWAWDDNLTDADGPYVELMAGAFTDNQPDFSWLAPGETKTFSQHWYPIREIGPAHQANLDLAIRLDVQRRENGTVVRLGVGSTRDRDRVVVELRDRSSGSVLSRRSTAISPDRPYLAEEALDGAFETSEILLVVTGDDGDELIGFAHRADAAHRPIRPAVEPPAPAEVGSVEELFLIGQYLEQYRHATRKPEPYWREAVRRDPGHVGSHVALAGTLGRAGLLQSAEDHLLLAVDRLTTWVPNPADGEAHYRLGVNLVRQGQDTRAVAALTKAMWTAAWHAPAGYALARIQARHGELSVALKTLDAVLAGGVHGQAEVLRAHLLGRIGRLDDSVASAERVLERDPLDQWARDVAGRPLSHDSGILLDVALEYAAAGSHLDALRMLRLASEAAPATADGQVQTGALILYHRAAILDRIGRTEEAADARSQARTSPEHNTAASRLEDVDALLVALDADPTDARAALMLGNWTYDRGRHHDAIDLWNRCVQRKRSAADGDDDDDAWIRVVAHRNLGIAAYNVLADTELALEHFEAARTAAPDDAKLFSEYDQLVERLGRNAAERLSAHEANLGLVLERDDLGIANATLLIESGDSGLARERLLARRFQPWEGGEGQVLAAWDAANLALAEQRLDAGDADGALGFLRSALEPPTTLGEARHPLANCARIHWLVGCAADAAGDRAIAEDAWDRAASSDGDFLDMSPSSFSTQTEYTIRALLKVGRRTEAATQHAALGAFIDQLAATPASIDYFATSLPTMLLFHEDPADAQAERVSELRAAHARLAEVLGHEGQRRDEGIAEES
ncbi:tetratricopeptide repeat protein [Agromyces italicus]|uniref:tetratricopeptide repeat protein n=1 Tax=Agromyces italicus TaxID=279572 RepID=UPI00041C3644|nr:DUF5107 domain-containing protein [Agromyces italicus]